MKAAIINSLRHKYHFKDLLNYWNMPRSTYYYEIKRYEEPDKYETIKNEIKAIYKNSRETYGYRRVFIMLRKKGFKICAQTTRKLMRKLGLMPDMYWGKNRKYSSYKGTIGKTAPNILNQKFDEIKPLKVFHTDITEIKMENDKKGYISLIMDEASNEIMGLQVSDSPNFNLVRNTLNELYKNNPCLSGAIIHSDQGFHYQLESYRKWIDKQNVLQSMSRKGNCLDNSPVESQIGLMKKECLYREKIDSLTTLKKVCSDYKKWFNYERISRKKELTPIEY
ncbi:IS3 family transposase, partial [Fructilactobacillus sanfranciscensis]|uniref:IS3 family transposase n=2 Tax=Fructilactobacillus sanfranciscensis TaxID=1625 RepID=UPI001CDAE392